MFLSYIQETSPIVNFLFEFTYGILSLLEVYIFVFNLVKLTNFILMVSEVFYIFSKTIFT